MGKSRIKADELHGKGFDLALEYIDKEIRGLERRKEELERMSERLIAKHELFERELSYSIIN